MGLDGDLTDDKNPASGTTGADSNVGHRHVASRSGGSALGSPRRPPPPPPSSAKKPSKEIEIPKSKDADQIDRDVARCSWHLLTGSQRQRRRKMRLKHKKKFSTLLKRKQRRLGDLINLALVSSYDGHEDDKLRYYQGYHDVASIFLSALGGGRPAPQTPGVTSADQVAASIGLDLPSRVLQRVSETHFRDTMRSSFHDLQIVLRLVIMPLILSFDQQVHDQLYYCEMEPFFALSWIITWFGHDVRDTDLVKRLYDAFLVSHPLFAVYVAVAIVCHPYNRAEILSTECDFAAMHHCLVGLPKNSSMVGFVYKLGDGYVSGADDDDDDTTTTDMVSSIDLDGNNVNDESMHEPDNSVVVSSTPLESSNAKVPFQEIIDTALVYMRRIPPRSLLDLAKHYYPDESSKPMFEQAKKVTLLQRPPRWALTATATADWVLKQRARARSGRTRSNRRDRRGQSPMRNPKRRPSTITADRAIPEPNEKNNDDQIVQYLQQNSRTAAVIACGFGPGDDANMRRRKKRRKLLFMGGAVLLLVTFTVVLVMKQTRTVSPAPQYIDTPGEPMVCNVSSSSSGIDGGVDPVATINHGDNANNQKDLPPVVSKTSSSFAVDADGTVVADIPKKVKHTAKSSVEKISTQEKQKTNRDQHVPKKEVPSLSMDDSRKSKPVVSKETVTKQSASTVPVKPNTGSGAKVESTAPKKESVSQKDNASSMPQKREKQPSRPSGFMVGATNPTKDDPSSASLANKDVDTTVALPQDFSLQTAFDPESRQMFSSASTVPSPVPFRGVRQLSKFVKGRIENYKIMVQEKNAGESLHDTNAEGDTPSTDNNSPTGGGRFRFAANLWRNGDQNADKQVRVLREVPPAVVAAGKVLRTARKSLHYAWSRGKDFIHEEASEHFAL